MNRRSFIAGCTVVTVWLAGCSGSRGSGEVGGPVESGSLDGEQVTHELDVQSGETIRIDVDGSFNNPKVIDPDGEDLLGEMIITDNDITLTATAEQTGTHRIDLTGQGSYEIYIDSE